MIVELLLGVGLLVLLLVAHLRRHYGTLEKCGVPVIPPSFCFGSGPWMKHKVNMLEVDMERFRKYGSVYGTYLMSEPWIAVSDPVLIKLITVKYFDHFTSHLEFTSNQKFRTLEQTNGAEWKDLRKAMSPTFTSGKIKGMLSLLGSTVDNMICHLDEQTKDGNKAVIEVKNMYQAMALDVISKCVFGIEENTFQNPKNELLQHGRAIMEEFQAMDFATTMFNNVFDALSWIINYIDILPASYKFLSMVSTKVVTERQKSGKGRGDFVDRLVEMLERHELGELTNLTKEQIMNQGIVFILAGFETTASTLSSLSYNLVKNPKVLEKLVNEVDDVVENSDGEITHETITEMPWMEACIKESLRLFPPIPRNDRVCTKDWEHEGLKIKKGTKIGLGVWVTHHNAEYWPEPEQFKPERFLKENADALVPCAWIPFGSGPRACIGERFSMVEMKVALTKLLHKFRLEADEFTKLELTLGEHVPLSYGDVHIKISRR